MIYIQAFDKTGGLLGRWCDLVLTALNFSFGGVRGNGAAATSPESFRGSRAWVKFAEIGAPRRARERKYHQFDGAAFCS